MKDNRYFESLLKHWGLDEVAEFHVIQDNVHQIMLKNNRRLVLKQLPKDLKTMQRLCFEYDVLRHVEKKGVAIALPLLSDQGTPYVSIANKLFRLSHCLQNQPHLIKTAKQQECLYLNYGKAIASFHQALSSYEDENLLSRTWTTDLKPRVLDKAVPSLLKHLNQAQLSTFKPLFQNIKTDIAEAYVSLPTQLIIWDCHPGNVAVNGFEVSGFLDCDHLSVGTRISDLANFLVHLIKWDIGNAQKEALWLEHLPYFIIGYETILSLTKCERAALYYAMLGVVLIFMDFFLQGEQLDLIETELKTFVWLVTKHKEFLAQMTLR